MLIVNADDLGRDAAATNAILSCWIGGRISSASAMVFMQDSERAAAIATEARMEVGLHLNLSEEFSGSATAKLRDAHKRVRQFLGVSRYALVLFNPMLTRHFRYVVEAQQEEFYRLYGHQPSHIDGHHHLHLATNLLLQEILPPEVRVRRSFSFMRGERGILNRMYRAIVDKRLARHNKVTGYFFALAHHLSLARLERVVALAKKAEVELMTHPHVLAEYEFLLSDAYAKAVATVLVSRRDLQ